jgi:intracellular multiplication protein IcmK
MQAVVKKIIVLSALLWTAAMADAAVLPPSALPSLPQDPAAAAIENVNPVAVNDIPNLPVPDISVPDPDMTLAAVAPQAAPVPASNPDYGPTPPRALGLSQPSVQASGQMAPLPPLPGAPTRGFVGSPAQARPQEPPGSPQSLVFQDILKQQFPLSNDQIRALHLKFKDVQRAIAAPPFAPRPTVSSKVVVLSPGSIPPVIRLASGYVSSVVFVDQTGAPWPLQGYDVGDPGSFNIAWDRGNILMIQGSKPYATGNMAVKLSGLPTPVMLTLVNDQKVVDYRIDLRVQGLGPNARPALGGDSIPPEANSLLLDLLQGIPPTSSQALTVTGGQAQAWMYAGRLLLRTSYTVLSPSWSATMSSADGTKVYEMGRTPLILVADNGRIISLKVEGL